MKTLGLNVERQLRFLAALSESGDAQAAAETAEANLEELQELRGLDPEFATAWRRAEEAATDKLEALARARAIEGFVQPVTSDGKVVRDDRGQPLVVRGYADNILLSLLRAQRPEKYGDWKGMSDALYPRWVRWLSFVFVGSLSVWVLGSLIAQLTRGH
jgi:hypothetical protein